MQTFPLALLLVVIVVVAATGERGGSRRCGRTTRMAFSAVSSSILRRRRTVRPVLSASTARYASISKSTALIREDRIPIDNGRLSMQVLVSIPKADKQQPNDQPVLLFLHGSFHGAWCWAEHYMEYFTNQGYSCVAPSWRGTGGTPAGENVKKVQIIQHVSDLQTLLRALPKLVNDGKQVEQTTPIRPPVVIAHSFGGLAVMKLLEMQASAAGGVPPFSGIVTMCSVPPSGNGKMTMRYLTRSLEDSWKITAGFAMKQCTTNPQLCRDLFFGGSSDNSVSDEDVQRYQNYFQRDSAATIDLFDLGKQLPSLQIDPTTRKALFWNSSSIPCLVMGATDDFIVDEEALIETARYFGVQQPLLVDSPHDVMLGHKWRNGAQALEKWISETIV